MWTGVSVDEVAQVVDCKHVTAVFTGQGFPVASIGQLGERLVNLDDAPRTTSSFFALLSEGARRLRPGDLIMSRNASVGRVSRVAEEHPSFAMGQDVVLLRARPDRCLPEYLQLVLQSAGVRQQLEAMMAGSTFKRTNVQQIKQINLLLPGIDEQQQVVCLLEDAEDLELGLGRVVAKKRAIKHGMMQQLLTGRTRLANFAEPWRELRISHVAAIDPETLPATTDPTTVLDYISLEDVERGELLGSTEVRFGAAPSRARRIVREFDVLFGTVRPNLQSHVLYRGQLKRPIASTGFAVVRATPSIIDPRFLFALLMSRMTSEQVDRIIAGSNYPAVSSTDVRRLSFDVPDLAEQRAIAAVLADADAELGLLQRRLAKSRDVKQGIMQELLTGRIRLPVEESAA